MAQNLSEQRTAQQLLKRVKEGMTVHDAKGTRIGKVRDLYFGSAADELAAGGVETETAPERATLDNSVLGDVARAVFGGGEVPEALRSRLLRDGFVRIDSDGLFASDCYATPDQISNVGDDEVHLMVLRDDLIKRE